MKKNLSILGILLAGLLTGCSSESNSSHSNIVNGQWKLVNVSGSFAGINNDFPAGTITWDFNPTTQMVTVVNNNTDDSLNDILETGIYNYQIINSSDPDFCSQTIKINNHEMGCFSVVNDTLQISEAHVDGFTISLAP